MLLKNSKLIAVICFIAYIILGVSVVRDYGLSWDEPISRLNGIKAYQYVFEGNQSIFTYRDRYYGTAFELPLYALEKWSGLTDPETVFFLRHVATFLVFYTGVTAFYLLCTTWFASRWWGLVGAVFLVMHPRIFADSFYNSKDTVFLAAFIIAMYTGIRFIYKPTVFRAIVFAACAGFATDIRIIGGLVHMLIIPQYIYHNRKSLLAARYSIIAYILCSIGFVYIFWPVLWSNPITHVREAIRFMGNFSQFQNSILYFGTFIPAQSAPWHYLPVWIAITTPVIYIVLFFVGIVRMGVKKESWGIMLFIWIAFPIMTAMIAKPSLYDGWRQFYFTYPAFVIVAVAGFKYLFQKNGWVRIAICCFAVATGIATMHFMVRSHPYQHVYFNELIGGIKGAEHRFDLDYWGLSFKKGLLAIAQKDPAEGIPVFIAFGIKSQVDFLPKEDRRFIPVSSIVESKYVLSNFRWQKNLPPYPELHSIVVDGVKIMGVYKVQ